MLACKEEELSEKGKKDELKMKREENIELETKKKA